MSLKTWWKRQVAEYRESAEKQIKIELQAYKMALYDSDSLPSHVRYVPTKLYIRELTNEIKKCENRLLKLRRKAEEESKAKTEKERHAAAKLPSLFALERE